MRIYAVADIHGKPFHIHQIKQVIKQYRPDLLVIAGDITSYFSGQKTIESLKDIGIPIYGIRGNEDFKKVEYQLKNQHNSVLLTKKPVFCCPLAFVGTNGTLLLPFISKICFQEQKRLNALCIPDHVPMVLVTHPPPRGTLDKVGQKFSAGSFVLRNWIVDHQPLMVLCGHIHEQAGFEYIKNTLVVNCAMNKTCGGAIIDYDKSDGDENHQLTVNMIRT